MFALLHLVRSLSLFLDVNSPVNSPVFQVSLDPLLMHVSLSGYFVITEY
jgi:hypothetical protein